MSSSSVPEKTQVLVIGGGPSGSYAAAVLARRNINVTVLEAAKFPRYHIGESLLASINYFLEYIGARDKIMDHGFIMKPGGAFKLRKDFPTAYTNFVKTYNGNYGLNVNRSEFDDLLFRHAGSEGAKIIDEHKVTSFVFSEKEPDRPVAANWECKSKGTSGTIAFDYVIDASGRQGLLATKYHKDRKMTQSLKNTAIWAYWKGAKLYGAGTEREGAPIIESMHDNTGWCWYIPVNDDTISVGFVMHEDFVKSKKAGKTLEELYHEQFQFLDEIPPLKEEGTIIPNKEGKGSPVYMASDYSYASEDVGRLNYRIAGDAAAFIDPFFSSGVHLALVGALSAALSIISIIDGKSDEETAARFHENELKTAYTRFFLIVIAGYKQMRGGVDVNVLNDIEEDNFDRAFDMIRPVIQGTGDIGVAGANVNVSKKLSEEELSTTLDFVLKLFGDHAPNNGEEEVKPTDLEGLDRDARTRLSNLSKRIPELMSDEGVKSMLDSAQERMRVSILKAAEGEVTA